MDARLSGGEGASWPGFDRASLARPQGRLRAPNVRSVVLCLSYTGPSAPVIGHVPHSMRGVDVSLSPTDGDRPTAGQGAMERLASGLDQRGWPLTLDRCDCDSGALRANARYWSIAVHSSTSYSKATPSGSFSSNHVSAASRFANTLINVTDQGYCAYRLAESGKPALVSNGGS